jgi:hypothetical protein
MINEIKVRYFKNLLLFGWLLTFFSSTIGSAKNMFFGMLKAKGGKAS